MNNLYEDVKNCYNSIKDKITIKPKIALVLGSGLGDFAEQINITNIIDYKDIAGFPKSTVEGHKGRFVFGYIKDIPLVIMQGRVHYYEGYSMDKVVLPIRLMKMMGAEVLFLTNASGGINKEFNVGDFMVIKDQISSFVPSPLIGKNFEEFGTRFPDMSEVYSKDLIGKIELAAKNNNINIQEGVYLQLTGPNFESPAEIKMCSVLGADAVGMSTTCEAVAAKHIGMKICGISCITNMASGISETPLSHEEVSETADRVAPLFKTLVEQSIIEIGKGN
ncbi:purine-nucleoside phosphorylase [Miniphocaeibacter massiliensis]|uniref:purine-nucleoside phosphorylase n=1 Tax=Miniphocaeibacter massiliensis TaxID=2041841 RepID=UPI000C1BEADC|nr:purine-nucleoside phosphorylase [Miniphocaeibacter massiliensis]